MILRALWDTAPAGAAWEGGAIACAPPLTGRTGARAGLALLPLGAPPIGMARLSGYFSRPVAREGCSWARGAACLKQSGDVWRGLLRAGYDHLANRRKAGLAHQTGCFRFGGAAWRRG